MVSKHTANSPWTIRTEASKILIFLLFYLKKKSILKLKLNQPFRSVYKKKNRIKSCIVHFMSGFILFLVSFLKRTFPFISLSVPILEQIL